MLKREQNSRKALTLNAKRHRTAILPVTNGLDGEEIELEKMNFNNSSMLNGTCRTLNSEGRESYTLFKTEARQLHSAWHLSWIKVTPWRLG